MFNKKGEAIEELRGALTFVIAMFILLLIFSSCQITKEKKKYEQFKLSKEEAQITKDLNFFLKIPVDRVDNSDLFMITVTDASHERNIKMSELIVENLMEARDASRTGSYVLDGAKKGSFKSKMDNIAKQYLQSNRRLVITLPGPKILYDSQQAHPISAYNTPHSIAILPVPKGQNEFDFIEIALSLSIN